MTTLRGALIWLYLGIQITVPAVQLFAPDRPARFGWQMFSGSRLPWFSRVGPDGRKTPVSIEETREIVGVVRSEMDYERYVPPFLCLREPRAEAIEIRRGSSVRSFSCRIP